MSRLVYTKGTAYSNSDKNNMVQKYNFFIIDEATVITGGGREKGCGLCVANRGLSVKLSTGKPYSSNF